ncbi:RDD family protein [Roseateles sp. DC23W]|uniref:RDD family protein n=1 Tax=Pelomonas dachongensis TaxID=3299029 RepID=A0ABW7ELV0_9BURK
MSDAVDQRFAPPQALVADVASEGMVLAGRGTRLLAAIVDALIAGGVAWAALKVPLLDSLAFNAGSPGLGSWRAGSTLLGLGVFLLVQGWPLLARGQTLGKMLLQIRIVRCDGSKPEAWRLLGLRYGIGIATNLNPVVAMVYGLIDSLLIFRESRQCLHDTIADTKVIKL